MMRVPFIEHIISEYRKHKRYTTGKSACMLAQIHVCKAATRMLSRVHIEVCVCLARASVQYFAGFSFGNSMCVVVIAAAAATVAENSRFVYVPFLSSHTSKQYNAVCLKLVSNK